MMFLHVEKWWLAYGPLMFARKCPDAVQGGQQVIKFNGEAAPWALPIFSIEASNELLEEEEYEKLAGRQDTCTWWLWDLLRKNVHPSV